MNKFIKVESLLLPNNSIKNNLYYDNTKKMEQDNPYLRLRKEKMARNQARLQELGLHKPTTRPSSVNTNLPKASAKKEPSEREDIPLRRSSRKRSSPSSVQDTPFLLDTISRSPKRSSPNKPVVAVFKDPQTFPSHSARAMELNVFKLIHGDSTTKPGLLGKKMAHTGKAHVMEESARLAVDGVDPEDIHRLSFNKYSGVQEWGNRVMFLWVNLGAPNSEVINEFYQGGRQVSWFGGSRMHEGTPVIQKLKAVVSKKNGKDSSSDGIILWCRKYIAEHKTFSPYVCLGRLSVRFLSAELLCTK